MRFVNAMFLGFNISWPRDYSPDKQYWLLFQRRRVWSGEHNVQCIAVSFSTVILSDRCICCRCNKQKPAQNLCYCKLLCMLFYLPVIGVCPIPGWKHVDAFHYDCIGCLQYLRFLCVDKTNLGRTKRRIGKSPVIYWGALLCKHRHVDLVNAL